MQRPSEKRVWKGKGGRTRRKAWIKLPRPRRNTFGWTETSLTVTDWKTHDQTGSCRYSWRKQKEVGTEEIWVESNTTHSLKGSTAFPLALYHLKSKGPFYLPVKDKPFKNQSIFITMWKRLSFVLGSRRKPACVHSYYLCRGHCISESMSYSKANYVYKRFVSTVTADAHFTVTLLSQKKQ